MLLFTVGLGLLILHAAAGRHFVTALYDGSLTPVLGDPLEGRNVHGVDHYHSVVNRWVAHLLTTIAVLALALMCLSLPFQQMVPAVFALDVLFIAVDRAFDVVGSPPLRFSVSSDSGYPEMFQYIKEAGIAAGFVGLYTKRRCRMYLVWSTLFLYVVFDDAFQIHEGLGFFLSAHFQFPAVMGLRPKDLGELLVMGSVGTLFIAVLALTYFEAAPSEKRTTWSLLVLLGILALFGTGLDMVAMALKSEWLEFVEDAGEMLAVSTIVWYVHRHLIRDKWLKNTPPLFTWRKAGHR
jgi:hypothetical protein